MLFPADPPPHSLSMRLIALQCTYALLFLSKAHRLLDSNRELLLELLEGLVWGQIKTVETAR